jgi:diguanylate cyclase (GGDEF)-like protein
MFPASGFPTHDETLRPAAQLNPVDQVEARAASLPGEIWHGCWERESWPQAAVVRLVAVFVLVTACSWMGIMLSRQSDGVATIWLSNGMIFGLLITQPKRRWLAYFIAGLTADTLADMVYGDPFRLAIGVSVANLIEVVSSSLLLTLSFGWPLDLSKRKTLVGFLLISVIGATAVTSAIGASWTLLFVDAGPWWQMFRTWYLGDILGMALLAPLVIMVQRPAFFSMLDRKELPHTLLFFSISMLVTVLVFIDQRDPLIFFLFPAFLLVAFRLGLPGTVVNIFLVTLLAIGFTVKGHGPLMLIPGEHMLLHRIVIAQILGAVGIFTMFPVAALLEEREALRCSLAESEARYRSLAHADELTGLFNRRAFNLQLERAWTAAQADARPLAMVLVDADLFKQYNDVFGHLCGDDCLRDLANIISGIAEQTGGIAARFGGEEFALILPGTALERALEVAEEIRCATATLALQHPTSPFGIQTVSLGVATLVPMKGQPAMHLVMLADKALYNAKVLGRNQVACAQPA